MQNRCISNTSRATARSLRLARAIGLTLACAATPAAWAQSTPAAEAELEEIVVTGFRASLAESLEIKRTTATAVDTILAEDIADFPDLNLAESLQRIRACRSPATPAKAARSQSVASARSSRASASTAWRPQHGWRY